MGSVRPFWGNHRGPKGSRMMQDVIQLRDPADRERAKQILLETLNQRLNEAEEHILKGDCSETVEAFLKTQISDGPTDLTRRRAERLYRKLQQKIRDGITSDNPEPAA